MTSPDQNQFTSLAPYYDELMAHVPYSAWVDYVLKICKRYKHPPQRVLDCACGTGNVTFELASRGFEVVGVDYSEEMIEVARHKSTSACETPPTFVHSDLCAMELNRKFDTVTCLYDSLNYLTSPQMLERAFVQISKHLQPGGLFIFDMNAPYAFETDMFTQSDHRPRQKLQYDWIAHYDRHSRLCQVEMTYTRRGENGELTHFKEMHCERSYSMGEIETCLRSSGLNLLETFDSYRIAPPHARSERWYFVACNAKNEKR
jgi:ubiquinone/menaquinone biosynthesis C-methylase UbiE